MADDALPNYFQRVHRRSQHRAAGAATRLTAARQPRVGAKRYGPLRNPVSDPVAESRLAGPTTPTVIKTTPIASLGEELARLKAQQDRTHAPRWWSALAAHPVRTAIAAVLLVFFAAFLAIGGPIAFRSYQAYQRVFVTQVPDDGGGFSAGLNPEGTPIILAESTIAADTVAEWNGTDRVTILLLGVDRRANEEDYSRSDTIILVNVDPVGKTARMISIPRDLKVIVPGFGAHKINAAYAFGDANEDVPGRGPGLMMRTIETNFGININYFAEVDFAGFVKIVDTVGGVTLNVPYPIRDNEYPAPANQYTRIYFPSGWQHMNGERVLQYARTRHDDGDGRRSARQQQVLLALREQALSFDLIKKAPELIGEVGDTVRTDLDSGQTLQLARLATEIDQSEIEQLTLDPALLTWSTEAEFYFQADWGFVGDIMSQFTGEQIVPPMSALANPRYDTTVSILDGTLIPGLGPRVLEVVQSNGFKDSTTVDLPDAGNYPLTQIITSPDNMATAYLLAGVLGVPETAIVASDTVETPTAGITNTPTDPAAAPAQGTPVAADGEEGIQPLFPTAEPDSGRGRERPAGEIIIILGDDCPDPAWYNVDPNAGP